MNMSVDDQEPNSNSLSILTDDILREFAYALASANEDYQRFVAQNARTYKDMESGDCTYVLRAFLKARIKERLGAQTDVRVVTIKKIFGVVIGRRVFIHLKKLDDSLIAIIPKTLLRAKNEPQQTPLPGFEKSEPTLGQLDHVVGGYMKDEAGLIKDFYFNVQEGVLILDQVHLEVPDQIISLFDDDVEQTGETTFSLKKTKGSSDQGRIGNA